MTDSLPDTLLALDETRQCVMCGMCAPHCPTYQLNGRENESPRGRINLIRSLLENGEISANGLEHLENCRLCLRCQQICPSKVNIREIFYQGRAASTSPAKIRLSRLFYAESGAKLAKINRAAGMTARLPGGRQLLKLGGRLLYGQAGAHAVDSTAISDREIATETDSQTAELDLFLGCAQRQLDASTIHAGVALLNAAGHHVAIPEGQTCCGGVPAMQGDTDGRQYCAQQNREAFNSRRPLIYFTPGCRHSLEDMQLQPVSVAEYLTQQNSLSKLSFSALSKRVSLHLSCSLAKDVSAELALLQAIPGLQLTYSHSPQGCCGAGGAIQRHDQTGQQLGRSTLNTLLQHQPDIILSLNLSCAEHLRTQLAEQNLNIPVMHPLALAAQQLNRPTETVK